jgi:hypothetical protein
MMPVGPFMIEHGLIEKMIKVMQQKVETLAPNKTLERTFTRLHAFTGCILLPAAQRRVKRPKHTERRPQ